DEDQCLEGQAEDAGVELGVVAGDRPRAFQGAQAAVAGRDAEADPLGQFGKGQPAVALKLRKYLPVNVIHGVDSSTDLPSSGKVGSTFRVRRPRLPFASRVRGPAGLRNGGGMAIGTVVAFWAVSFLLVLVPGADWAYAIAAGLRDQSVLPAVAGL